MTDEELAVRIKAGTDVPGNMLHLWQQTKDFIHTVAMHYRGYADVEDLEQEGYLALYDAVDGYCPEQGCKFLTYAKYWMRQRMKRYIDDCCRTVRIPVHEQQKIHEYRKLVNAFQVCLGRRPTEWEVMHNLGLDDRMCKDLAAALMAVQVGSLDSRLAEDEDGTTVGDMVPCDDDIESAVLDELAERQLSEALREAIGALSGIQSDVIRHRYHEGKTVRETGEAMGLAMHKVRSMEFKALQELRYGSRLARFLPEDVEAQAYRHNGVGEFNRTWESSTERAAMKLL